MIASSDTEYLFVSMTGLLDLLPMLTVPERRKL